MAFVKAIDYVEAFSGGNAAQKLLSITKEFQFEREVLEFCTAQGMSKIIRFYGHDEISADGSGDPMMRVSCLIMEAGDKDLRRLVLSKGAGVGAGCAWNLYILSDVAQAIAQLHGGGIAHHDVKPSNVIATKTGGEGTQEAAPAPAGGVSARQEVKVADLGRVLRKGAEGPFDDCGFAGDRDYGPLEASYRHTPTTGWSDAREAADAYMVGSLAVFLFTGASLQGLVWRYVHPKFYSGSYHEYDATLIAILVDATAHVLHEHLRPTLPAHFVDDIIAIVKELTHPDPTLRGDKRARRQLARSVGMDRIHQRLLLLARRCAAAERGRLSR